MAAMTARNKTHLPVKLNETRESLGTSTSNSLDQSTTEHNKLQLGKDAQSKIGQLNPDRPSSGVDETLNITIHIAGKPEFKRQIQISHGKIFKRQELLQRLIDAIGCELLQSNGGKVEVFHR
jgi:hypothetical protein